MRRTGMENIRQVLLLRHDAGLSYRMIGAALGVSRGTISNVLTAASEGAVSAACGAGAVEVASAGRGGSGCGSVAAGGTAFAADDAVAGLGGLLRGSGGGGTGGVQLRPFLQGAGEGEEGHGAFGDALHLCSKTKLFSGDTEDSRFGFGSRASGLGNFGCGIGIFGCGALADGARREIFREGATFGHGEGLPPWTGAAAPGLPGGLDQAAGAPAGSGVGRLLRANLRKSRTARILRFSRRRVGATSRPRALMGPMAKRRRRVVFSGP